MAGPIGNTFLHNNSTFEGVYWTKGWRRNNGRDIETEYEGGRAMRILTAGLALLFVLSATAFAQDRDRGKKEQEKKYEELRKWRQEQMKKIDKAYQEKLKSLRGEPEKRKGKREQKRKPDPKKRPDRAKRPQRDRPQPPRRPDAERGGEYLQRLMRAVEGLRKEVAQLKAQMAQLRKGGHPGAKKDGKKKGRGPDDFRKHMEKMRKERGKRGGEQFRRGGDFREQMRKRFREGGRQGRRPGMQRRGGRGGEQFRRGGDFREMMKKRLGERGRQGRRPGMRRGQRGGFGEGLRERLEQLRDRMGQRRGRGR
jgi:Skp family chaperone for outer membrane proteins